MRSVGSFGSYHSYEGSGPHSDDAEHAPPQWEDEDADNVWDALSLHESVTSASDDEFDGSGVVVSRCELAYLNGASANLQG